MRHFQIIVLLSLMFLTSASGVFSQGFNMWEIARFNPSNPSMSNSHYSALWGYVAPNNREYAILGAYDGTYFYDVTDTGNVVEVGFVPSPDPSSFSNSWREMKTYSHYAYVVSEVENSGIQIIDLQYLPDSIHYVGQFNAPGHSSTHSISQSGPYLYLNGSNGSFGDGTVIFDLSINPEQPVVRGKWDGYYVHDSRIVNDTIWACNISDDYVSVIDATNKDSLRTITQWLNLPNPAPHNIALTNDRKYAYVTDENTGPGRLKVWDVSDLGDITFVTTWIPAGFENSIVHNIEIYDTIAVIAYYSAGVRILNISNPEDPYEIAWFDTYPDNNATSYNGCWGVYRFPSGNIIASDRKYGLLVLGADLNPAPSFPDAEFTGAPQSVEIGDSVKFFDLSTGVPDNWQWTVTGNQMFNSTLRNPSFSFTQVGQYTVKLRVSNGLGADSITKINYINVTPTQLNSFSFTTTGIQVVPVSQNDTNKVTYKWTRSASAPHITYKFRAQKFGGTQFILINSDNNGQDTSITFSKSYLDSLAAQFGTNGDSVLVTCKAYAYNGFDSVATGNNLILNIKRTTVGINQISSEIPGEFKLENNYPNPFNPETTIKYQLPKAAFVTIKLYDITGREVAQLVNQRHEAGYYDYQFDGSYLSSGVYFYRIEAGQFTDVKRMLLIK